MVAVGADADDSQENAEPVPPEAGAVDDPAVLDPTLDSRLDRAGLVIKRGTMADAGTLSGLLKVHGLGAADSQELAQSLEGKFDVRRARPEHSYVLRIDPTTHKLQSFTYRVSASEVYDVVRGTAGALTAARRAIPVQRIHLARGARVASSLSEAVTRAGLRSVIVGTIAEILTNEVDFYAQQRAGDVFRVVADEERVAGSFQRYGPILALAYEGERAGSLRVYHFGSSDDGGYYTAAGRSVEREYLRSPLKFVHVTSPFDPHRMHPILHRIMGHMGVDLAAPIGTPVYASSPGTIISRGDGGAAGNLVEIQHADGLVTIYAHLSRFEPGQSIGMRVEQRQVIGYVGATGRATGPHLHYGMKKNGRFIDPLNFEVRPGRPVPRDQMDAFHRVVARMDRELESIVLR
jgi:murein DD-endopeptidase MepM/ murein hydrolase activator NlpD